MGVKSIVIDASASSLGEPCPFKEGDTVHVSDIPFMLSALFDNDIYCVLDEFPPKPFMDGCDFAIFLRKRFVPLSDIDETRVVKEVSKWNAFKRISGRFPGISFVPYKYPMTLFYATLPMLKYE